MTTESSNIGANGGTVFFTIVARNYLAQARALGESVKRHHSRDRMTVFVLDDEEERSAELIRSWGMEPMFPPALVYEEFRSLAFQYDVMEASTAVKPRIFQKFFEAGFEHVVYLDPDIVCFRPLDAAFELLRRYSVVLTSTSSSPQGSTWFPDDRFLLMHGAYNLGFIATRNDANARRLMDWWWDKLQRQCLIQVDHCLFVDQKWMDLAPAFFDGVAILRDRGYNMSWWNLHERTLVRESDGWRVKETGEPLVFYHFSSFTYDDIELVSRAFPREGNCCGENEEMPTLAKRPDLRLLFEEYRETLERFGHEERRAIPYGYGNYANGEPIQHHERRLYLESSMLRDKYGDPFAASKDSFLAYCRSGVSVGGKRSLGRSIKRVIRIAMRMLLACVGLRNFERLRAFCAEQAPVAVEEHLKARACR